MTINRHGCVFRPLGARTAASKDTLNDLVRHRIVREPADGPLRVNRLEQRYLLRPHSGNKDTTSPRRTMYNPSGVSISLTEGT